MSTPDLAQLGDELHVVRQVRHLLDRKYNVFCQIEPLLALGTAEAAALLALAPSERGLVLAGGLVVHHARIRGNLESFEADAREAQTRRVD